MQQFDVALDSWVMADGPPGNFYCGQRADFGVSFYPVSLSVAPVVHKHVEQIKHERYRIIGEIINPGYGWKEPWMVDFGIIATADLSPPPPPEANLGSFVAGELRLHVDRRYSEKSRGVGPDGTLMIYSWQIERIFLQTAC